jgi:hemerythrin
MKRLMLFNIRIPGHSHHLFLPDEVLDFLKDWWLNHIRTIDIQYAPFLSKLNLGNGTRT